jgi:glycosyltransferase involved in cell wall biosynthesis
MRLWILGDGDERLPLQQLALELALPEDSTEDSAPGSIQFAGWLSQQECKARLNAADCLVLPSLFECGGAVVLEAMALGKPVIATAWGGPLDYLDAECGILVEPVSLDGLVDGLAAAMLEIANSPEKRRRMGDRALAKIRSHYSWKGKVGEMIEFYDAARRSGVPSERKGAIHRG